MLSSLSLLFLTRSRFSIIAWNVVVVGGYLSMSSHLEYYSGPGAGGGMLPAGGGVMQGMEDSMQGLSIQPGRPLSVCSVSSCGANGHTPTHRSGNGLYSNCNGTNPQDELMDDELLMSLSVRELNKRLHGCPREQVSEMLSFSPSVAKM